MWVILLQDFGSNFKPVNVVAGVFGVKLLQGQYAAL
jgi:hypothetical protein